MCSHRRVRNKSFAALQGSGVMRFMHRSDGSEGIIRIEHDTDRGTVELDTWLVVRKRLNNASQVGKLILSKTVYLTVCMTCTQFKAEVEVTEVALAFPLGADLKTVILAKVNIFNVLQVCEDLKLVYLAASQLLFL